MSRPRLPAWAQSTSASRAGVTNPGAACYEATPPGFVFAVKGNRFLTHMLKLRGIETPLANVLASGVFALRDKLGPFLWQFPPQLRFDADKVEHFLGLLPHDTGRALLEIDAVRPLRHAVEVRRSMRSG